MNAKIIKIATIALTALAAKVTNDRTSSAINSDIKASNNNCGAFPVALCELEYVKNRCPQSCNSHILPSSSTPSPISSSIPTTPLPISSSIPTTPSPISIFSSSPQTSTPPPEVLIKTNQITAAEQINQGEVTTSNSKADVTSSVKEPISSPLPASDIFIASPLPLSSPPPISSSTDQLIETNPIQLEEQTSQGEAINSDTQKQTITDKKEKETITDKKQKENKESFYTKPPFIIGTTISGALILGGAVGYFLRQINKKKEGAEDGPRNLEAQEENNNTVQARGGNDTPSRAPSADADTGLRKDEIMIMIDTDPSVPPPSESSPSPLNSGSLRHSKDKSLDESDQEIEDISDSIDNSRVSSSKIETPALLQFAERFGPNKDSGIKPSTGR